MAMKGTLGRLRQLENAVLRVEATMMKQSNAVSTLKADAKSDPTVIASEEAKLKAIEVGGQGILELDNFRANFEL